MSALASFTEASVRMATPLAYAALGELVVERAGVINIGLEGSIIAGAYAAMVCAGAGGAAAGVAGSIVGGVLVASVFALFVVALRADQIITGTAISLLGLGLTGALYQTMYDTSGAALRTATLASWTVPKLADIPFVGRAFFMQPILTYALYAVVPALAWWMYRTPAGLALRAVGEHPEAAAAAGVSPSRVRWFAIIFGGMMGGLSGATLVLAQVGTFTEGMSAGRGFIAIAIVALGRWTPTGVVLAALLFGGASALQFLAQSMGWSVPYQFWLVTPYLLTLIALAGARRRSVAPAGLGARTW
jgi:simple sugar transport system permease protein